VAGRCRGKAGATRMAEDWRGLAVAGEGPGLGRGGDRRGDGVAKGVIRASGHKLLCRLRFLFSHLSCWRPASRSYRHLPLASLLSPPIALLAPRRHVVAAALEETRFDLDFLRSASLDFKERMRNFTFAVNGFSVPPHPSPNHPTHQRPTSTAIQFSFVSEFPALARLRQSISCTR
jgi:hypothetical protein